LVSKLPFWGNLETLANFFKQPASLDIEQQLPWLTTSISRLVDNIDAAERTAPRAALLTSMDSAELGLCAATGVQVI
jgi:hypothetical protein